jgi:hypothetical protein
MFIHSIVHKAAREVLSNSSHMVSSPPLLKTLEGLPVLLRVLMAHEKSIHRPGSPVKSGVQINGKKFPSMAHSVSEAYLKIICYLSEIHI